MWIPKYLAIRGIMIKGRCTVIGLPIVELRELCTISIGSGAMLISRSFATALGVSHPIILRAISPGASIHIGDRVGISGGSICAAKSVAIGEDSLLGADAIISDTDFHGLSPDLRRDPLAHVRSARAVTVGRNVFIGTRSIILKGSNIGDNSVIGAGSVVTGDIPPNVIAAGNPCRVIRKLGNL